MQVSQRVRLDIRREWPVVLLLVPYLWLVNRLWFLCDDAYITFRYAKNLARGYGVTFNTDAPPVEGYSNFLWMVICAVLEADLWPVEVAMPALSALIGGLFLLFFWWTLRVRVGLDRVPAIVGTAVLATCPAFGLWATSGLATMPFAALVFVFWERATFARGRHSWLVIGLVGILLTLVRTEGVAWVGVIAVLAVAARWVDERAPSVRRTVAPVVGGLLLVGLLFAVYSSWRVAHFGDWLPNTAHAKVGMSADRLLRGAKYVGLFGLTFPAMALWLLGVGRVLRWRVGAGIAVSLLAIAFPLYGVVVGGDFFPMGRMILPSLAFGSLLFAALVQGLWERGAGLRALAGGLSLGALLLGILPAFDTHVVPVSVREPLHFRLSDKSFMSEFQRWENLRDNLAGFARRGHALARIAHHDDRVVSQAIGVIGYYSELHIYDQYGLVDREVALLPVPPGPLMHSPGHDKFVDASFFAKYEPEILASRTVQGPMASRLMKDSMDKWSIPESLHDTYVPDFVEVALPGYEDIRSFLLMVRKVREGERPRQLWAQFPDRRKDLLASFGDEAVAAGEASDEADDDS
ncbi:MAG: arabinofuranosyltransferase [Myxococcota bacterium]|jgi:arabinofuranosyltransferase